MVFCYILMHWYSLPINFWIIFDNFGRKENKSLPYSHKTNCKYTIFFSNLQVFRQKICIFHFFVVSLHPLSALHPDLHTCKTCSSANHAHLQNLLIGKTCSSAIRGPRKFQFVGKSRGNCALYCAKRNPLAQFAEGAAVVAQLVEHQLPKLRVTGSSPAYRSLY